MARHCNRNSNRSGLTIKPNTHRPHRRTCSNFAVFFLSDSACLLYCQSSHHTHTHSYNTDACIELLHYSHADRVLNGSWTMNTLRSQMCWQGEFSADIIMWLKAIALMMILWLALDAHCLLYTHGWCHLASRNGRWWAIVQNALQSVCMCVVMCRFVSVFFIYTR